MQKIKFYSIVFIFSCFAFSHCQWLKKQAIPPDQIVLKFIRALESLNIDLAITYCDSSTALLFQQFRTTVETMGEQVRNETVRKMQLIQNAACEIDGDIARCRICCDEEGRSIPEELTLRLVEGHWLIALNLDQSIRERPATPPSINNRGD